MASIHDSYLGVAEETSYGTAVAPDRFFELTSEGIEGKYERIDSEAYRAGQRVLHKDRFAPNPKGAEGDVELEVLDSGFGLIFKHALGSVTSGAPASGFTTHTASVGDLRGRSLTWQVGRADSAGTIHPFTYEGGKVKGWELSNAVDGILMLKLDLDFAKETIGAGSGAYALATPTYPVGAQLFTFLAATVSIGGTEVAVKDLTVKGDNALKTDRYFVRTTVGKKESLEAGLRKYEWELKCDFDNLAQINRVAAAIAAGTLAAISAVWTSPQGGQLTLSMPHARFDEGPITFDGAEIIEQAVKGVATWDGAASPVTVAYKTKDVTP